MLQTADPARNDGRKEVVFIDTTVTDWRALVSGAQSGMEVVLLNGNRDGLTQMAAWAESKSGYDAVHVLSHGDEGHVTLGTLKLDTAVTEIRAADLAALGAVLKADGDLLLYGCSVASGEGTDFIAAMAARTGADVAASDDLTGEAAYGGDWVLESSAGTIESAAVSMPGYRGTLIGMAPSIANLGGDTLNYTVGGTASLLDQGTAATVTDGDSSHFNGGSLIVAGVGIGDRVQIRNFYQVHESWSLMGTFRFHLFGNVCGKPLSGLALRTGFLA